MRFTELAVQGAFLVDAEPMEDGRGFFARTFCMREFEARGLDVRVAQCSVSYNVSRGTLRGLHYQAAPGDEAKLVRCTSGAIHDVIVDMRPGSPTHLRYVAVELTGRSHRALYIPAGVAHGYQSLSDGAEVAYQMSSFHAPALERGVRYDDPVLGIRWPIAVTAISAKDRAWPLLDWPVELAGPPGSGRTGSAGPA